MRQAKRKARNDWKLWNMASPHDQHGAIDAACADSKGVKRGQFDAGKGFALAAGGMQVGSDHGGIIKNAGGFTVNGGSAFAGTVENTGSFTVSGENS